jgi:hypothetical protein
VPKYVSKKPKIIVCLPTRGIINIEFVATLLPLVTARPSWCEINVVVRKNRYSVAAVRNSIARDALNAGADYILWLDDDMLLDNKLSPVDAIKMLYDLDAQIASGVCMGRANRIPMFWHKKEDYPRNNDIKQFGNIFEADGVGLFFCLVKREVFEKMKAPYFEYATYDDDHIVTEDMYFMNKANELGYKVKVRQDVRVNHMVNILLSPEGLHLPDTIG